MPYLPHIRVTALGGLAGVTERFSYGLNLAGEGSIPTIAGNTALWDDMAADFIAFHSSAGANIAPAARLLEVKFAAIGVDGKYLEDSYISPIAGTNGGATTSPYVLPQTAMAVSLNSSRRGASGKGRFYVPMFSGTVVAASLLCVATDAQGLAVAAATLVSALNDQPGIDPFPQLRVVIASTKGVVSPVESIRVGRVIDTMRSRRRQMPESYGADVPVTDA